MVIKKLFKMAAEGDAEQKEKHPPRSASIQSQLPNTPLI